MPTSGAPITEDFRFSSPPVDLLSNFYFYLAAILVLLVLYWLIRRGINLRKRSKAYRDRMTPKRDALAELKAAHADWKKNQDVETYSLRLTMAVRRYLEQLLGPNCSKQTATQFLRTIKSLRLAEDDEKLFLNLMVQKCELAKFADQMLSKKEVDTFHQRTLMFVNNMTNRREMEYQQEQERLAEERKKAAKRAKEEAKAQRKKAREEEKARERDEKQAQREREKKKKTEEEKEDLQPA